MSTRQQHTENSLRGLWPFMIERRLDWSELDQLGHANNARYFTWFEEARMAYFQRVGVPTDLSFGWGPILAHTDCHFLAPVPWPSTLLLGARVTRIGNSSFTMEYSCFRRDDDQPQELSCVATGTGVIVLITYVSGEKLRVNDEIRGQMNSLDGPFSD